MIVKNVRKIFPNAYYPLKVILRKKDGKKNIKKKKENKIDVRPILQAV